MLVPTDFFADGNMQYGDADVLSIRRLRHELRRGRERRAGDSASIYFEVRDHDVWGPTIDQPAEPGREALVR